MAEEQLQLPSLFPWILSPLPKDCLWRYAPLGDSRWLLILVQPANLSFDWRIQTMESAIPETGLQVAAILKIMLCLLFASRSLDELSLLCVVQSFLWPRESACFLFGLQDSFEHLHSAELPQRPQAPRQHDFHGDGVMVSSFRCCHKGLLTLGFFFCFAFNHRWCLCWV